MSSNAILEKLSELLSVSTLVGESILAERVYCDCPIFVNHKSTMDDLIELDMVYFDCHSWYGLDSCMLYLS